MQHSEDFRYFVLDYFRSNPMKCLYSALTCFSAVSKSLDLKVVLFQLTPPKGMIGKALCLTLVHVWCGLLLYHRDN